MTDPAIDDLCGKISPDPVDILLDYKLDDYLAAHRAEQALLLNPYFDDPTQFIAYAFDDIK